MKFLNKYDDLLSKEQGSLIDVASDPRYQKIKDGTRIDIKHDPRYQRLTEQSLNYLSLAISTPQFEKEISHYLSEKFNHNTNAYDRAIDLVYNRTHVGGPTLHHNLDANHTWHGAIDALRDEFPDEHEFQHVLHASDHLLRDLTTPSGINPFLDPTDFQLAKDFLQETFHMQKSVVNDLLNINAAELLGATAATISLALGFGQRSTDQLGEYFSRLGFSSYMAGNPALLMLTGVCLAKVCYDLWNGESVIDALDGMIAGGLSATTFWCVAAQFSGPLFVGIIAGAVACFAVNWCYKKVSSAIRHDLDQVLQSQFAGYRSYYKLLA
jgi:hypothetical protein